MPGQQNRIQYLLQSYANDRCTRAELHELMQHIRQLEGDAQLHEGLTAIWQQTVDDGHLRATDRERIYAAIAPSSRRLRSLWWMAAAAVLAAAVFGITQLRQQQQPPALQLAQVIGPGTNKAMLTLADGSTVTLDSNGNQQLQQGNTAISQHGGQLQYHAGANPGNASFNTLSTPRGGQFRLTLPDGSRVWLNAASSLTYPTAFAGSERKVEVLGEAYFEIAANAQQPFIVKVRGKQEIKVLGTSFNINAYADEPYISTTLTQGAILVNNTKLAPGQQAQSSPANLLKIVDHVNTEQVTAWKNGLFNFSDANLYTVMRQLERWYDITVEFKGELPDKEFRGKMQRSLTLQQVLEGLGEMGVHFTLKGRILTVTP